MPCTRPPYPPEFRAQIVAARSSGSHPRGTRAAAARGEAAQGGARHSGESRGLVRSRDRHDPERCFGIVRANRATFPVAAMCRVLGISESGISASGDYAGQHRAPSRHARRDAELRVAIRARHARSDATYGAPRVRADLAEAGHHVGCKRVARLMRADGLTGVSRRKGPPRAKRTTPEAPQAPDRATPSRASRLHGYRPRAALGGGREQRPVDDYARARPGDARTQAYVERRTGEGRSRKEIFRCLKRYLVRELYPLLLAELAGARDLALT